MAIVSLSQAAELTGKSKSVIDKDLKNGALTATRNDKNVWQISTDDLFALYPEKEQQKCERLEAELAECRAQLLSLEDKFKDEIVDLKAQLANEILKNKELQSNFRVSKTIKINYNDAARKMANTNGGDDRIQWFLNFIETYDLSANYDVLNMFIRVLEIYIGQHRKYNAVYNRREPLSDFTFYIDGYDYQYMMFGEGY